MDNEGAKPKQNEVYSSWPERNFLSPPVTTKAKRLSFDAPIDRRKVIVGAALAGAGIAAGIGEYEFSKRDDERNLSLARESLQGEQYPSDSEATSTVSPTNETTVNSEIQEFKYKGSARLFDDETAQRIVESEDLELSPRDFFEHKRLKSTYHAHQSPRLHNVFLARVMEREKDLNKWAEDASLPVNVVATIMNLESGGINNLTSESGAVGLFQVIPNLHMPDSLSEKEQMDPDTNAKYALKYFASLVGESRRYFENSHPTETYRSDHPEIYIQAMAMYNAGASGGAQEFKDLPRQTQDYITQARGLFRTMEIDQRLHQEGKTDDESIWALRSQSMDARGRVFELIRTKELENPFNTEDPFYAGDPELFKFMGQDTFPPTDNPKVQKLIDAYTNYYEKHDDQYLVPLGPSQRIWTQISPMFVVGDPINQDPEKYFEHDSSNEAA